MDAVHIRTHGLEDDECAARVEMSICHLSGVVSVIAVKSLDITSVLFCEEKVSPEELLRAVHDAGFDAELVRPEALAVAS